MKRLFLFLLAASCYAQTPLALYLPTAGSGSILTDTSGNSYAGTLYNSPVWLYGGGLDFNGSTQYAALPNGAVAFGSADFAIVGVIQPQIVDGPGTNVTLVSGADPSTNAGWMIRMNSTCSGKIEWWNGAVWICSTGSVANGVWTTFAITQTGTTLKVFINGSLDSTLTAVANPTTYAGAGAIGADAGGVAHQGAYQVAYLETFTGTMSDATAQAWTNQSTGTLAARYTAVNIIKPVPTLLGAGTVNAINGSGAVVGSGTTFSSASVGKWLEVGGIYVGQVATYTDATHITVSPAFSGTSGAYSYVLYTTISRNSVAPLPPLGWVSWYYTYGINERLTAAQIATQSAALKSSGLQSLGYTQFGIEEPGMVGRDVNGHLFSHRVPSFAISEATIAANGQVPGIYLNPGKNSCMGYYGSMGWESTDFPYFASLGFDFLEYDWCSAPTDYAAQITSLGNNTVAFMQSVYQEAAQQVQAASWNPLLYVLNSFPGDHYWVYQAGWNAWRYAADNGLTFAGFAANIMAGPDYSTGCPSTINSAFCFGQSFTGPGLYNYADLSNIGDGPSATEGQTMMSVYAMLMSPIMVSTDLTSGTVTSATLQTFGNPEVLAVSQDAALIQGASKSSTTCGGGACQVWLRQLAGTDTYALALTNTDSAAHSITATFISLGLSNSYLYCRDLWAKSNLGTLNTSYTATVPSNGVAMIKISNTAPSGAFASGGVISGAIVK